MEKILKMKNWLCWMKDHLLSADHKSQVEDRVGSLRIGAR
jgi:hypothetical protein